MEKSGGRRIFSKSGNLGKLTHVKEFCHHNLFTLNLDVKLCLSAELMFTARKGSLRRFSQVFVCPRGGGGGGSLLERIRFFLLREIYLKAKQNKLSNSRSLRNS